MQKNVLLVEDEDRIREIVSDYFKFEGFNIYEVENGRDAMVVFEENKIDLIILDIMIPKLDGWSVCKRIRNVSDVPIIMLTARSEEDDKLMGFELGADDYVTKPFSPKVLVARAKMLLKRAQGTVSETSILNIGCIEINKLSRSVKIDSEIMDLAPKEYDLLIYMIENKGIVLSRENILNKVWGYDYFGELRTVDTHIKKLRKKLKDKSSYIRTIIRAGYIFEVD
ncbi:response regulator [Tepidibacter hydrothermalis]|uniref:Stage 0 sporulation protein A homolog n=1 Tax=Tepidibacter hydrothermalis TaxID=3036126 RepID=A0ABY8EEJ2_9FIRM|nr:response regulator transcription factor [Tepidibacter hydrothermalis]WFD11191.1 response regulator transcription factor [Tepidibacter hydrothermalis]